MQKKNMQESFYNDLDRSADESCGQINKWLNVLKNQKNIPKNNKTIYIIGPNDNEPEITRGPSENLYLVDKSGNKRTIRLAKNGIEVIIEDKNQKAKTLVGYLNDRKKSYYVFNGELKTAKQPGNNYLNARVYVNAGKHSKKIHTDLSEKYFSKNSFKSLNERIEALKIGKIFIDPSQEF
jgi:hypothetical protein